MKLILIFLLQLPFITTFGQLSFDDFYQKYLNANFPNISQDSIKNLSLKTEKSIYALKQLVSTKIYHEYLKPPFYTRSENRVGDKLVIYCFNEKGIFAASQSTFYELKNISPNYSLLNKIVNSNFINSFFAKNTIKKNDIFHKIKIVDENDLSKGIRCYKVIQEVGDEFVNIYFISSDSFFVIEEIVLKNGIYENSYIYEEYRLINGFYYPFKKTYKLNGGSTITKVLDIKINENLPLDFFDCIK